LQLTKGEGQVQSTALQKKAEKLAFLLEEFLPKVGYNVCLMGPKRDYRRTLEQVKCIDQTTPYDWYINLGASQLSVSEMDAEADAWRNAETAAYRKARDEQADQVQQQPDLQPQQ
jgi:hypothetical protein